VASFGRHVRPRRDDERLGRHQECRRHLDHGRELRRGPPLRVQWAIEAKKVRNAKLVHVDPRYTRTSAVCDHYAPLRAGSDIAFLHGIIRYAIEKKRYHED